LARRKNKKQAAKFPVLQYFGAEDIVVNVAAIVHDENRKDGDFSFQKNGFRVTNRRYFNVQSIQETEVLSLAANDIEHMKRDFPISTSAFFRKMMQQTKNLLHDHLQTFTQKDRRLAISRWSSAKTDVGRTQADDNMSKVFKMYRIKQMTNNSKQYSTIEFTEHTSKSKIDMSANVEEVDKKKSGGESSKAKELATPYLHKQFIETYISHDKTLKEEKSALQRAKTTDLSKNLPEEKQSSVVSKLKSFFSRQSDKKISGGFSKGGDEGNFSQFAHRKSEKNIIHKYSEIDANSSRRSDRSQKSPT